MQTRSYHLSLYRYVPKRQATGFFEKFLTAEIPRCRVMLHVLPPEQLLLLFTLVKSMSRGQEPGRLCHRRLAIALCPHKTPPGICYSTCLKTCDTSNPKEIWGQRSLELNPWWGLVFEKVCFSSFFTYVKNQTAHCLENSPQASHPARNDRVRRKKLQGSSSGRTKALNKETKVFAVLESNGCGSLPSDQRHTLSPQL